jgi:hypothetical protein
MFQLLQESTGGALALKLHDSLNRIPKEMHARIVTKTPSASAPRLIHHCMTSGGWCANIDDPLHGPIPLSNLPEIQILRGTRSMYRTTLYESPRLAPGAWR